MNNPIAALVVLMVVLGATVLVFVSGDSTDQRPVGEKTSETQRDSSDQLSKEDVEDTSKESETGPDQVDPQSACGPLGVPIPVVRNTSALHRPEVVQKVLSSISQATTDSLLREAPKSPPANVDSKTMVWIPGGTFVMGSDTGPKDEAPPHAVAIDGFWMDRTEVTNAQFQAFVDATGYVTLPEKQPELRSVKPGFRTMPILEEFNQPGSICSLQLKSRDDIDSSKGALSWWQYVPGANWRNPEGPDSSIEDRMNHPVVHLSWLDIQEYCHWTGKSLPTEAQWEYAARGGLQGNFYPWGNDRNPEGKQLQNIWQGTFPITDTAEDGFKSTAPVATFPPNAFGLYDMTGNVWEWCNDFYKPNYYRDCPQRNPPGPDSSFDPQEPAVIKRVQRGGSFMCSDQYCIGYRVSARMKGEIDTGMFHTGFRCVVAPESAKPAE